MKKGNAYITDEDKTVELSNRIGNKEPAAIVEALRHGSYFCAVKAMIVCAKEGVKNADIVEAIKQLKDVDVEMVGNTVGEYAKATLHVMNEEKYTGDSPFVLGLIEAGV